MKNNVEEIEAMKVIIEMITDNEGIDLGDVVSYGDINYWCEDAIIQIDYNLLMSGAERVILELYALLLNIEIIYI